MRLAPRTQVGTYEIAGRIGAGGMGEVYRARDRRLNRDVAIKVLPQAVSQEPERLRRFTREAHTLAALSHANIAHVYDAGTTDGTAYLVMELVEGEDLSALIAQGPLPLPEALPIARQIADAREETASVSPDGNWCAYLADESGRPELYVQSFPESGRRAQISTSGALVAWWTRDSRALIFVGGDRVSLWRAAIEPGVTLRVGAPTRLATLPPNLTWMDAMPDRARFLALMPEQAGTGAVTLVQHWQARLK